MTTTLLIAAGGAIGAVLRYLTGLVVVRTFRSSRLITGTVVVNILGCFLAGLLLGWFSHSVHVAAFQIFFMTGVMSSYTTFSTFALEALVLIKHSIRSVLAYLVLQIIAGTGAAAFGFQCMEWWTAL